MALELFHNDASTCSQKVRICLAEKDVGGSTAMSI